MTSTIISDVRTKNALPYGGIPFDLITKHYEQTDPALIAASKYTDAYNDDPHSDYDNYVRAEIVDWSPDVPYLESDHARRDPGLSRSQLNLRYNSTRGSRPELPRHPEMFIGFIENDPRGALIDPRLDQIRGIMSSQAANLTVRMGDNDDNGETERPWTGQSISYGMKYVQDQVKKNTKIFTTEKDGRPFSRNLVTDAPTWGINQGKIRKSNMDAGGETIDMSQDYGEYIGSGGFVNIGSKGVDSGKFSSAITNPWTNTQTEGDMSNQYGNHLRQLNNVQNQSGFAIKNTDFQQDYYDSYNTTKPTKKNLAASMALAAKNNKNRKDTQHDTILSDQNDNFMNGGNLAPSNVNVSHMYKHVQEGQERQYNNQENNAINTGLQMHQNLGKVSKMTDNSYNSINNKIHKINNVTMIAKGLKEGSASSKRNIQNHVQSNFNIGFATDNDNNVTKHGQQSKDYNKITQMSDYKLSPLLQNELASGVTVQQYTQAKPYKGEDRVRMGQFGHGETVWNESTQTWQVKNQTMPGYENKMKFANQLLSPTEWKNHNETVLSHGKNPEQQNRMRNNGLDPTNWQQQQEFLTGKGVQATQSHLVNVGQHTYTPNEFDREYKLLQNGKNQSLSSRRSAGNDPTELGDAYEKFGQNFESSSGAHIVAPKTLKTWESDHNNEDDDDFLGDF